MNENTITQSEDEEKALEEKVKSLMAENDTCRAKMEAIRAENEKLRSALDNLREQKERDHLNNAVKARSDVNAGVGAALDRYNRMLERRELRKTRARQRLIILAAALVTVLACLLILWSGGLVSDGTAGYIAITSTIGAAFAAGLNWPAAWRKYK